MYKFAFLIPASYDYIPGLAALLASIEEYNPETDVALVSYQIPDDFKQLLKKFTFHLVDIPQSGSNQKLATIIERFRVMAEVGKNYEAICFLDADMFLFNKVDLFFEIASKGFVITASNATVAGYNQEHQQLVNVDLGVPEYIYPKMHTAVPVFTSPMDLDWFQAVYDTYNNTLDDFTLLNMLGIKLDKFKRMLVMPSYMFTGIHHYQVKPETALIRKSGLILSGTEQEVYMTHGKWWDRGWVSSLEEVAKKHLKDFGYIPDRNEFRIKNAMNIMYDEFHRQIDAFNRKTGLNVYQDFRKYFTAQLPVGVEPEVTPQKLTQLPVSEAVPVTSTSPIKQYFAPYKLLQSFGENWPWVTDVDHSTPFFSPLYYIICRITKAVNVLSIGAGDGYTSYILARIVKENGGCYYSIDSDVSSCERLKAGLAMEGIEHSISCMSISANTFRLEEGVTYNFAVIDGAFDTGTTLKVFEEVYRALEPDGYLALHHTDGWNAGVLEEILAHKERFPDFEFITFPGNYGLALFKKRASFYDKSRQAVVEEARNMHKEKGVL